MITAELVPDETKRDTKGRKITPKARREELLNEYEQSGLTQAAFARRAGVNYPTFASWIQGRRERTAMPLRPREPIRAQQQVQFAEVNLPPPTPRELGRNTESLSVTMPDGLVVRGADAVEVAALVKALRA